MLRIYYTFISLALLTLALWWPTHRALDLLSSSPAYVLLLSGIAGLVLAITALSTLTRSWLTLLWLLPLLALLTIIRLMHLGVVDFSGSGYTVEFFVHLEWQSVKVAWQEYGRLIRRGLILAVLLLLPALLLAFRPPRLSPGKAALALLAGAGAVVISREAMPEWDLFRAWRQWHAPVAVDVDESHLRQWRESGLVETELRPMHRLAATPSESPKNLILLYMESVGTVLTDHPGWPALMPELRRLLAEHAFVDYVHASSYITIEGITNTECGTLFPYARGNDSLASGDGLAERMVCLGDVLSEAGYRQIYMGGAPLGFAGKGAFLGTHGYDELYGLDEWRERGLNPRPGTWGLGDPDLFEQSLKKIRDLRQADQPWKLTLLTIGSHIPGYFYEECRPYEHSDEVFLNALHCTDQLLGRWVDRLEREGVFEDTVLMITADHHIFPSAAMRELFGDSVYDRRLPLVVIGDDLPRAAVSEGGGYDLAPTVLDLLDIRHNARFPLGRSLLDASSTRNHFFRRNDEIFNGRRVSNHGRGCTGEILSAEPPRLPLDACEKQSLIAVLGALAEAYSAPRASASCNGTAAAITVRVPAADAAPMDFLVGQSQQSGRFTRSGYPMTPDRPGLYLAAFSDTGEIVSLLFRRAADNPHEWLPAQLASLDARAAIAIWRPVPGDNSPRQLPVVGPLPQGGPGIWLLDTVEARVLDQRFGTVPGDGLEYVLSAENCVSLFDERP